MNLGRGLARHEFEGEQLTVEEIHAQVPALSRETIRRHLKEGRRTRQAMLSYNPELARRAGGKKGRARSTLAQIDINKGNRRD